MLLQWNKVFVWRSRRDEAAASPFIVHTPPPTLVWKCHVCGESLWLQLHCSEIVPGILHLPSSLMESETLGKGCHNAERWRRCRISPSEYMFGAGRWYYCSTGLRVCQQNSLFLHCSGRRGHCSLLYDLVWQWDTGRAGALLRPCFERSVF